MIPPEDDVRPAVAPSPPPPASDPSAALDDASSPAASTAERNGPAPPPSVRLRGSVLRLGAIFVAVLLGAWLVYLAFSVPGRWFTSAQALAWGPRDMQVTKGSGRIVAEELAVAPADASGLVVVSLRTGLKATEYAAVEWYAIDVPDHIDVSMLWRTDYKPEQLNSVPLSIVTGRLLPAVMQHHPAWMGNIQGLALAMKGPPSEPVRIRGVVAKPLSAAEVLRDRAREWFAFESWTGTSINTLTGGADLQDLPLPLAARGDPRCRGTARRGGASPLAPRTLSHRHVRLRWRPSFPSRGSFSTCAGPGNLVRQVDATADRFAGKSWVDKRLAVEDGPLFAFVQKAKGVMPSTPVRVFVAADSHYFRGRAAYHLYPHNAFFEARANAIPRAIVRPGGLDARLQPQGHSVRRVARKAALGQPGARHRGTEACGPRGGALSRSLTATLDFLALLVGLALPWTFGIALLGFAYARAGRPAPAGWLVGCGWLVGIFATTLLMRGVAAAGVPLGVATLGAPLLAATAVLGWFRAPRLQPDCGHDVCGIGRALAVRT